MDFCVAYRVVNINLRFKRSALFLIKTRIIAQINCQKQHTQRQFRITARRLGAIKSYEVNLNSVDVKENGLH